MRRTVEKDADGMRSPGRLRCEYLVDPLGIDVRQPRLSWEVRDARRGARQTAYQVRVASSTSGLARSEGHLWDTGQVMSGESIHIVYGGRALQSRDRCWWKVRTWDADGRPSPWSRPALWTMGLLDPADWQACWIEDPEPAPPDSRAHNGYRCGPAPSAGEPRWVTIDLGAVRSLDGVRLYGARPFDLIPPDAPGYLFPIRFRIDVADDLSRGEFVTVVDRTDADVVNPGCQPWTLRFPRVEARYARLFVTRLQQCSADGYAFALAEMEVLDGEDNLALGAPVQGLDPVEDATWSPDRLVDGDTWPHPAGPAAPLPAPMFRREFALGGVVRRATLHASALGLYGLAINGQPVGDQVLAPGWTDYDHCVEYQEYDVTALVRRGENAIGAVLGDGWYAGRVGMAQVFRGRLRGVYGRKPRLLAQLEVEMEDGTLHRVSTDAGWEACLEGPIRSNDIYDGVTIDAGRAMPGWDLPGFRDPRWRPAAEVAGCAPGLVAQMKQPVRVRCELPAVGVSEPQPGVFVIDFGRCFAGWVRLRCRGGQGQVVIVRHGQVLDADGTVHFADLRGALQSDRYTLSGDPAGECLEPRFTYHGFRYAQVTGLTVPPAPDSATGVVFGTDLPSAGTFASSDSTLDALWEAVDWTLRSNVMSVHTDCCDRDERLPWVVPDINQAEFYVADMAAFAACYTAEMRRAQLADGGFPNMAPNVLKMMDAVPGWGEASGIWMAWAHYLNYGDQRLLELHYPSACRWADRLAEACASRLCDGYTFGDWLNGDTVVMDGWPAEGGAVPLEVMGTACFGHSAAVVADMARALGRTADAERYDRLFQEFAEAFRREFVGPDGRVRGNTQAGLAMALEFDLLLEGMRGVARKRLLSAVARDGGRLTTGNVTTHLLLLALSRAGRHDLALQLVTQPVPPSWGYMIRQGATTIWERWDSYVADRRGGQARLRWQATQPWETHVVEGPFQDPGMNSYNHPGYLLVARWMVETILGIAPTADGPAYRRFTVRPCTAGLSHARGSYRSMLGLVTVGWRVEDGRFSMELTVPPGATAEAAIPCASLASLSEGGRPAAESRGVHVLRQEAECTVVELRPGTYRFRSAMPPAGVSAKGART